MLGDSDMATSVWQESIGEFASRVASPKPAPGGGAVAALSACLAASLLKMVAEIASKGGATVGEMLVIVRTELETLQRCVDQDIEAFNSFLAARKMPRITELEKTSRGELTNEALKRCAEVPLAASRAALKLVPMAKNLLEVAPAKVLSDLGVALSLMDSSLVGLQFNVNINLQGTASDPLFGPLRKDNETLTADIASARQALAAMISGVADRIGHS
jgi:methenyltetrahydrofolate cyclohydrolase